jgi:hypothetical protein
MEGFGVWQYPNVASLAYEFSLMAADQRKCGDAPSVAYSTHLYLAAARELARD